MGTDELRERSGLLRALVWLFACVLAAGASCGCGDEIASSNVDSFEAPKSPPLPPALPPFQGEDGALSGVQITIAEHAHSQSIYLRPDGCFAYTIRYEIMGGDHRSDGSSLSQCAACLPTGEGERLIAPFVPLEELAFALRSSDEEEPPPPFWFELGDGAPAPHEHQPLRAFVEVSRHGTEDYGRVSRDPGSSAELVVAILALQRATRAFWESDPDGRCAKTFTTDNRDR